jgi:plastocyanin
MNLKNRWLPRLTMLIGLAMAGTSFAQTTHVITVSDFSFSPKSLTIQPGDTVRWENAADGGASHNVVSNLDLWTPPALAEAFDFEVTFNTVGTFNYHCTPHRLGGMTGEIIVEEAVAAFQINAGLNDAWVSADAAFQGLFFTVFEDLGLLFLSWFTFDAVVPEEGTTAAFGAPDQRWVTGAGNYTGDTVTLNVELTSGGTFNGSLPLATQTPGYGTITIVFISCNEAIMTYNFPSVGLSGEMTLTRVVPDNVALCEMLSEGEL